MYGRNCLTRENIGRKAVTSFTLLAYLIHVTARFSASNTKVRPKPKRAPLSRFVLFLVLGRVVTSSEN